MARLATFALIAGVCITPAVLIANANVALRDTGSSAPINVLALIAQLVGMSFAQASIARVALDHLAGSPPRSAIDGLGAALMRIVPATLVIVLSALATLLGLALLIIPGVLVWLAFFVALPATMAEHCGPIAAIRRSVELTEGHRGKILGAALVIALVCCAFPCCCLFVSAFGALGTEPGAAQVTPAPLRLLVTALRMCGQAFMLVSFSTLSAVTYARLRSHRERIDVEAITNELS